MLASQRSFLIQSKNLAERKCGSDGIVSVLDYSIKLVNITDLSETIRKRTAEELYAQGYIDIERKRGNIYRFKLTNEGLEALEEGLRTAGKLTYNFEFMSTDNLVQIVTLLVDEIHKSNNENKQVLLEIADLLEEETNKNEPKKNVMAMLLGIIFKSINVSADVSTILSSSGLKPNELIGFAKDIFK